MCPHCRRRQKGGTIKWVVIGGVVFLVVVAAIAGGNSGSDKPKKAADSKPAQGNSVQNPSTEESSQEESIFRVGETAEMNNVQVTMTNYEESAGNEFSSPEEGNVFLMSEFEITNNSDKELAISSMLSFEAYADDYKLDYSIEALIAKEGNQLDGAINRTREKDERLDWLGNSARIQ